MEQRKRIIKALSLIEKNRKEDLWMKKIKIKEYMGYFYKKEGEKTEESKKEKTIKNDKNKKVWRRWAII